MNSETRRRFLRTLALSAGFTLASPLLVPPPERKEP